MSETMVERVARAARDAWEEATGRTPALSQDEAWAVAMRAAIAALRLPEDYGSMDHVVEAIQTEVDIWPEDKPRPSPNSVQFVSRWEAVAMWNAGIDAALK